MTNVELKIAVRASLKNSSFVIRRSLFSSAFTLIELILVMALLTIVIAVAAPSLANFFRGRALDSEAKRLVSLTRYAQSRAVSEGVPMVLWIDTRRRVFGLRPEFSYADQELKPLEYALSDGLQINALDVPPPTTPSTRARAAVHSDPNVVVLRFQPDGFIDPTSPRNVVLTDNSGGSVAISQSRNWLNYEIHTNAIQGAMR